MKKGIHRIVPLSTLKLRQTRINPGTDEELKALAKSWLENPVHEVFVRASDHEVIDGNRRIRGTGLLGVSEVGVFLIEGDLSDSEMDDIAMISSYHRAPLGGYEQACIVRRKKEAAPGTSNKAVAEAFRIDPGMITRLLSLFDCIPEAQQAAQEGMLNVSAWYAVSKADDQREALRLALSGASRESLERSRKPRSPSTERLSKIKCPVLSGRVVTVAGEAIGLEEAIEAMGEAIKVMREAIRNNLSARTAQATWKDKAAAG